jgi:uncharacterized protein (TIGR03000 family)
MYSVVLATVLTAGAADVPEWGFHGCHGCCGGCFGGSCGGCFGGCCGGLFHGCHGCHGGGIGGCYGSYGGCFGGCCGGSYGGGYGAVSGVWTYNCYGGCCGGWSAGGYGGGSAGCCGGCYGTVSYVAPEHKEKKEEKKSDKKEENEGKARSTQATVVVNLPADAKMVIDSYVSDLTSGTRTFVTPDLIPEQDYYYTITAEVVRDGRTHQESQRVFVRAGRTSRVTFGDMSETAARR